MIVLSQLPAVSPPSAKSKASLPSPRRHKSAVSGTMTTPAKCVKKVPRSRNGCWTCRNRKVKCDEAQPKCKPCARLGIVCDYTRRLNYKDDTPRVLRKLAKVTDTAGCPVYDSTATPIFSPYHPHHWREYEEKHDNGFVVLCVSDYADHISSFPDSGCRNARGYGLEYRDSDGSDDDDMDDDDDEDSEEYSVKSSCDTHKPFRAHSDFKMAKITENSQLMDLQVQPTPGDLEELNFANSSGVKTAPCSPQRPPQPTLVMSDFNVSGIHFHAQRHGSSSLFEGESADWCYNRSPQDQQYSLQSGNSHHVITPTPLSSCSSQSWPTSSAPVPYHLDATISITTEPAENVVLDMTVVHTPQIAYWDHHQPYQLHHYRTQALDQAHYDQFRSESEAGLVADDGSGMLCPPVHFRLIDKDDTNLRGYC
ncbi:hypothetical protein V1517DRAFT_265644 [Lipomyces orientalis]|uniref:Uncharacterized protein n=1 Tax=Lipomyces orientalis TaxID=1233043 RepID=A0ACC3TG55_9ASCO